METPPPTETTNGAGGGGGGGGGIGANSIDSFLSSFFSFGQRTAAWLALLRHTIDRISVYSGARRGDRSMLVSADEGPEQGRLLLLLQ
ncbi:hypothetical protein TYRP_013670 [Tyrophagus putrescentiae]|nr:hypothetical protein TYRP_013670 [Tyrophagus putrescentiae]